MPRRRSRTPEELAADRAAVERRMLTEADLAHDIAAKRAEHRIVAELADPAARSTVARMVRRLRGVRRA